MYFIVVYNIMTTLPPLPFLLLSLFLLLSQNLHMSYYFLIDRITRRHFILRLTVDIKTFQCAPPSMINMHPGGSHRPEVSDMSQYLVLWSQLGVICITQLSRSMGPT